MVPKLLSLVIYYTEITIQTLWPCGSQALVPIRTAWEIVKTLILESGVGLQWCWFPGNADASGPGTTLSTTACRFLLVWWQFVFVIFLIVITEVSVAKPGGNPLWFLLPLPFIYLFLYQYFISVLIFLRMAFIAMFHSISF